MKKSLSPLKTLLPYLAQYRTWLLFGFAFMLLHNYGYMKAPEYLQRILDEITTTNRMNIITDQLFFIGLYIILICGSMFLMRKLIISVSRKIEYDLRQRIYRQLLHLDYSFYQAYETGDIVSRCTNDLNDVRTLLGPGIMYVPNALTRMMFFIPVLIGLSGSLMLMICAILLTLVVLIVVIMPYLRPLFRKIQETVADINSRVWQVITGINTIKLYTLEKTEEDRFKKLNRKYVHHQMAVAKMRGFLWPFFITMLSVAELVILLVGGRQVIHGDLTIGELLQFNIMVGYLSFPVLSLGWVLSLLQQGVSAMERINTILDHPIESRKGQFTIEDNDLHFKCRNLSFRYPGGNKDVLQGINLDIPPGQAVGITGTIGSGKTTLLKLLTGLLKPERGMLFINNTDILNLQVDGLYRKVAVVPQDTFLFSRTIAENIALGGSDGEDRDRVETAARQAGLDQDIHTFPLKYEELVGERGITLSGGQKQRTAIARAFYRSSSVIVFDDALSSVDAKTEASILERINTSLSDRTLIIVSHRISALKNADIIYVMDQGIIVESGTHPQLLEKNGMYARLTKLQQMETALSEAGHGR